MDVSEERSRNEEFRNLYLQNIIKMIKPMEDEIGRVYIPHEKEVHTKLWWENL
jgi:hypothetical protein